jgi:hypothetical protein
MAKINELEQKDISEARAKAAEALHSGDTIAAHFIYYYSWFWAVSSTLYFFCVTFISTPEGGQHFADIILGFLLGTAVATVIGFFYGNSNKE